MEQPEIPLENLQEHVEHHAHTSREGWAAWVALSTAILAAFAAVAGLMAGFHANEAMICQIESSNAYAFFQAKGIKASVLETRVEMLRALGKPTADVDEAKLKRYENEKSEILTKAKNLETRASGHLHRHVILARGVTMFQISIAVAAISALTKRIRFWIVGLAFGGIGLAFLIQGVLSPG